MWRRTYLLLLLIRVYFAWSPSYLHPDENFQGPEVFAGMFLMLPWFFMPMIFVDQHSHIGVAPESRKFRALRLNLLLEMAQAGATESTHRTSNHEH